MLRAKIKPALKQVMKFNKRVLLAVPFFYAALISQPAYAICASGYYDETVQIRKVHDGDTLKLTDGRKIRIIGINTPELARDNQTAEPYADKATQNLKQLLRGRSIELRYGKEKHDRYGRLLAHVFLPNGQNVTELMLKKGMGLALTVPPNLWAQPCYQQAERSARQQNIGLWQHARYQAIDVQKIQQHGYYRIKGTVQRVNESRSAYWLNMGHHFALKIKKSDARYFISAPIKQLTGKTLIARGWIYPTHYKGKNELRMRIRHPAALDVVN